MALGEEIKLLDLKGEEGSLELEEVSRRKELFAVLWEKSKMKEKILVQKSRSHWLKEGYANSSYLHACINSRRRWNSFLALQKGDVWLQEVIEVKDEIVSHFAGKF